MKRLYAVDSTTARVLWFTDDLTKQVEAREVFAVELDIEEPPGFTLDSCWQFKLVGSELKRDQPSTPVSLVDQNKLALLKLLTSKVNRIRHPFVGDTLHTAFIRQVKLDEAKNAPGSGRYVTMLAQELGTTPTEVSKMILDHAAKYDEAMFESERLRVRFKRRIQEATTAADLQLIFADINKL